EILPRNEPSDLTHEALLPAEVTTMRMVLPIVVSITSKSLPLALSDDSEALAGLLSPPERLNQGVCPSNPAASVIGLGVKPPDLFGSRSQAIEPPAESVTFTGVPLTSPDSAWTSRSRLPLQVKSPGWKEFRRAPVGGATSAWPSQARP